MDKIVILFILIIILIIVLFFASKRRNEAYEDTEKSCYDYIDSLLSAKEMDAYLNGGYKVPNKRSFALRFMKTRKPFTCYIPYDAMHIFERTNENLCPFHRGDAKKVNLVDGCEYRFTVVAEQDGRK